MDLIRLQAEVLRLRQGPAKARLLRAIERTEDVLWLRDALRVLGLSASRYHRWRQAEHACGLDDQPICPRPTPTRLTAAEILAMKGMVESPEYRQVPTGRLAILAQRLGKLFAAPAIGYTLARSRGWHRPRARPPRTPEGRRACFHT